VHLIALPLSWLGTGELSAATSYSWHRSKSTKSSGSFETALDVSTATVGPNQPAQIARIGHWKVEDYTEDRKR
jgi:hypothetical protein